MAGHRRFCRAGTTGVYWMRQPTHRVGSERQWSTVCDVRLNGRASPVLSGGNYWCLLYATTNAPVRSCQAMGYCI
uniref:Uncharacterized protein n=1 Tax=Klebsiella quasipneumoniae TaxID=1463165 RepID=A0A7L7TEP1_9ENTR|nr:Hypothetical protein [Klebsiella quasipneumoniae]